MIQKHKGANNESTRDIQLPTPHVERIVRTIRVGPPATAKASTLQANTSKTKSKESPRHMAAFIINHPILTMLVLWLITLIGFVCIFALPIR